ncbi:MAG TPA: hypothetical protein VGI47_05310 [Candidatus Binataceae bacterium]
MFTTLRFLHGSNGRHGPADIAHDFVVKALPKTRFLAPTPYEYHCIRCGWSFIFNRPKGRVTALDQSGAPLGEPDNPPRLRTFAAGLCPALAKLARSTGVPKSNRRHPPIQEAPQTLYPQVVRISTRLPASNDAAAKALVKASG